MTIDLPYIDEDFIVAYKPSLIPTVPLKNSSGETLFSLLTEKFPEIGECYGKNEWEGGILHRLDTPTRGLVIAARNQESYDFLSSEQNMGRIIKTYRATVSSCDSELPGFPAFIFSDPMKSNVKIESKFRPFGQKGSSVRPVTDNKRFQDGQVYWTRVEKESDNSFLCTITKGFRHQIRCHLAWAGYPIVGDLQYGGIESEIFGLEAIRLSFAHPRTNKTINIAI